LESGFPHVPDSFNVRRQVVGEGRSLTLNNITVDCGAKGVACSNSEKRTNESAQMCELGPLDHSWKRSDADPGIEILGLRISAQNKGYL
jgi:hypothetical protein